MFESFLYEVLFSINEAFLSIFVLFLLASDLRFPMFSSFEFNDELGLFFPKLKAGEIIN